MNSNLQTRNSSCELDNGVQQEVYAGLLVAIANGLHDVAGWLCEQLYYCPEGDLLQVADFWGGPGTRTHLAKRLRTTARA